MTEILFLFTIVGRNRGQSSKLISIAGKIECILEMLKNAHDTHNQKESNNKNRYGLNNCNGIHFNIIQQ